MQDVMFDLPVQSCPTLDNINVDIDIAIQFCCNPTKKN